MVAEHIIVTRCGDTTEVTVDGVSIPGNAIVRDSVILPVDPDEPPKVCLELIASKVTATNTIKETP